MSSHRFTRLLPHYRRLMRDGKPARAVVVRSQQRRLSLSASHFVYRLTLEVHYADGSTAEVERTVTPFEVGITHEVGDVLPVRYDPADRSDVDVDVPALKAQRAKAEQDVGRRRVERARTELTADPLEDAEAPQPESGQHGQTRYTQDQHAQDQHGQEQDEAGRHRPAGQRDSADDAERVTGEWLERLVRLKLGHDSGTVSEDRFVTETAAARVGLAAGTALPVTGEDAAYAAGLAYAVLGDPVPGSRQDADDARRGAALLEQMVRLKVRHESGELDDAQFRTAQAELGARAQAEAERLDSAAE